MRRLAVVVFIFISSLAQAQQRDYDTSPEIVDATPGRSIYHLHAGGKVDAKAFADQAERSAPVVVHSHGCGGVGSDEFEIMFFYVSNRVNVVLLDFLSRGDAQRSCAGGPNPEGHAEVANPKRIAARRLELERQLRWLRDAGFSNIWVSGHSEGGRVVQGVRSKVQGIFSHGMGCQKLEFWDHDKRNHIHVFQSRRDPWLGYPKYGPIGCATLFNRSSVTQHWTDEPGHRPFVDERWKAVILEEIKRKRPEL